MIELRDVHKAYKTAAFTQKALDGVSLCFRESEFVAILGPSGSGKTTLLNVLGGLDRMDSGDLLIDGTSTTNYSSSDWDTYRNHRIGFVFQSYNLIAHQTVLSNVELALTLAGDSRAQRRQRALEVLERVGLSDHVNKRPGQLSGGQAQRVAIARALINDPDIILADEPTGALDTETGLQVMELLEEVSHDRLVIMVTHNPELAQRYSTRTVSITNGRITSDSHPFEVETETLAANDLGNIEASVDSETLSNLEASDSTKAHVDVETQNSIEATTKLTKAALPKHKASMSLLTAMRLSLSNLMTKKGRTILTAFAGSIGIIGIAAILALANGVNGYIEKVERDTLSSYPLSISTSSTDISSFVSMAVSDNQEDEESSSDTISTMSVVQDMFATTEANDLATFRAWLESEDSSIYDYVSVIDYDYGIVPLIYASDTSDSVTLLNSSDTSSSSGLGISISLSASSFQEMMGSEETLQSQYDVVAGRWATSYDECVLVLNSNGSISDYTLYSIGVYDQEILTEAISAFTLGETFDFPDSNTEITYDDILNLSFTVIPAAASYAQSSDGAYWVDKSNDADYMRSVLAEDGIELKVVGIIQANDETDMASLSEGIAYTQDLTSYIMEQATNYQIVQEQLANPEVDVFTGETFESLQDGTATELDLSNLISVDTSALEQVITFDSSALSNIDISAVNLSSLDSSALIASLDVSNTMSSLLAALELDMQDFPSYLQEVGFDITNYPTQDAIEAALTSHLMNYLEERLSIYSSQISTQIATQLEAALAQELQSLISTMSASLTSQLSQALENAISVNADALSNAIQINMTSDDLLELLTTYVNAETYSYESNLATLGYASEESLSTIRLYPIDFESKEAILEIIDAYNEQMRSEGQEEQVISYTDTIGALLSSVTDIINTISIVLIAFVSISLVVSSIMIGVITYISVIERKKEIGILRALGASKRNVASIFNAEAALEGLTAGVFAVGIVGLVSLPVNSLVYSLMGISNVMELPLTSAFLLIALSVFLTLISSLIPSQAAARKDPVEALRTE